ncbi:uncharacterized protein V6R79_001331 [Siganus canaliculatus]
MESSGTSPSSGPLVVPDGGMAQPSAPTGQLSESARPSTHRERPSKSPRRRRKGTRPQQRGVGHEQLLWEMERRRLPGQHEHLEPSGSASDPAESSPKRRAHFLHGPYPATHFGPKACILPNPTSVMHIQDPASQRLTWNKPPVNVLVIRKIRDESLVEPFKELCRFLVEEKQMMVYVERRVADDATLSKDEAFGSIRNQLCTFREGYDDISDCIDLIICLGGDGTLLYASSLFQGSVPPVMAFHLGSLGFLTPFKFESYKTEVAKVFEGKLELFMFRSSHVTSTGTMTLKYSLLFNTTLKKKRVFSGCVSWLFRKCGHHSAQSLEGEGGEGHASKGRSAAVQPRRAAAAGAQRPPASRTHQQRGWQSHSAAPGVE